MSFSLRLSLLSSVLLLASLPAFAAGDAAAGQAKSAVCAACHGADGNSVADAIPNLAGQKQAYLEAQLHALVAPRPLMMTEGTAWMPAPV